MINQDLLTLSNPMKISLPRPLALGHFLAISILASNSAMATDVVDSTAPRDSDVSSTTPAQVNTVPAEIAQPAEVPTSVAIVKTEETSKPKPTSIKTTTLGIETYKDTTEPGQEVSQVNIPLGISIETEKVTFEVSIPYLQRTAPSGKIASSEHHESKKKDSAAVATPLVKSAGLGDVTTSLMYKLLNEDSAPLSLFAKGKLKLATADLASGLGTGQNDYSGELKVSKSLGNFAANASIGYAILGSPGEVEINDVKKSIYYNNIYFGSLGGTYQFSERLSTDMHLDLGQASETGGFAQRDLTIGMDFDFSPNKTLHLQALKSLTPGLKFYGVGASLAVAM